MLQNALHVYVIAVPSCFVTPNCIGEPINSTITFADCCTNFGVSYDLNGQCQPCPSTSKHKILLCNTYEICIYITFVHTYIYMYL